MACTPISGPGFVGFICGPDRLVNLENYGAKRIWMEWHNYLGPTFFRGKYGPAIRVPGEKTWAAFDTWHAENHKPSNDRVEGRDADSSRRVPSHDGLEGAD